MSPTLLANFRVIGYASANLQLWLGQQVRAAQAQRGSYGTDVPWNIPS
jgi:hypothetical protein